MKKHTTVYNSVFIEPLEELTMDQVVINRAPGPKNGIQGRFHHTLSLKIQLFSFNFPSTKKFD